MRLFMVGAMILAAVASSASAQSDGPASKVAPALKQLLAARENNTICFVRIYDEAHLKRHPRQKVREISLAVTVEHIKEDNLFRYNFDMRAKIKGVAKLQRTGGECGHAYADTPSQEKTVTCGVECDGGGVVIEPQAGNQSLLVHLAYRGEEGRIRMAACGESEEEKSIDLVSGADDKVFRLQKAPAQACRLGGKE